MMSKDNNKFSAADGDNGESTLFSDPSVVARSDKKKSRSAIGKKARAIIVVAIIVAVATIGYFIVSAIRDKHMKLAEEWDEFEALIISKLPETRLSELDEYASFAAWLAEHREDLLINKTLISGDEEIQKMLSESDSLRELVNNISEELKFAEYIDELHDDPEATVKLLEGEVMGTSNRIYMYDPYERSQIESIVVKNEYGEFGFYYDEENEDFFLKDHPEATYDTSLFSSLVVTAGKPTVIERVFDRCEDFAAYGLGEDQSPASFTVTSRDGAVQTVYVGSLTAAGNGYYARHADRDALYIIAASLESTVLHPLENIITPQLTLPMATADYYTIKNFAVVKNNEVTVLLTFLDEDRKNELGLDSSYYMIYPTAYSVNTTSYSEAQQAINGFTGLRTVVFNPDADDLANYGLAEPMYSISYEYNGVKQEVYFSEKNEDGNFYAVSPLFNLIAEVDGTTARWLDWELIEWVDDPIFMMNINEIATITVESETATRIFDLVGEKDELVITERSTGVKPEVQNFRQFYKVLLSTNLQGYVRDDQTPEQLEALREGTPYLTLTIETRAGRVIVYRFYPYQTLRAYYTVDYLHDDIDAAGEFYLMRTSATKIISDAEKVMTDTPVDFEARN